ncbi:hypothetical protein FRC06_011683, partial [Ceratobasidium sp. 370]
MSLLTTLRFSEFAALPYYVQEHIIDLIDHYETYLALVVTSFTQHLTWDVSDERHLNSAAGLSVDQVWSTFEQLTAVRSLDLRVHVASYTSPPPIPLFPNLMQVRVEGVFPQNALEQILLTSPYIRHLAIAPDTREYLHLPGEPHAYGTSIEHFLRACISEQAFRTLRTLDIGLESGVNPELASQFIEMSAEWIEELRIEYNFGEPLTAYENWVVPMLKSGRWKRLRKLQLPELVVSQ